MKPFSGIPREYKDCIKSIEKHARLRGLTEDKIKLTAYQIARDAVSDFIDRLLTADPTIAWDRMKDQLAARFAEVSDKQQTFSLLQKLKQKREEAVPVYAERLLTFATQAYNNINHAEVQRQLINF